MRQVSIRPVAARAPPRTGMVPAAASPESASPRRLAGRGRWTHTIGTLRVRPKCSSRTERSFAMSAVLPDITADIAKLRSDLEEHFGRTLSVPIVWVQRPLPASLRGDADSGDAAAGTMPVRGGALAATGRMDTCRIEIYPGGAVEYAGDLAFFQGLLGHEVTHCFQLDAMPDVAQSFRVPEWIIEGSAEYAGAVVTGGTYAQSAWNSWLGEPNLSLFRRAYSAIGAFATAEQSGADPWTAMVEMLTAPSSRSALETLFDEAPEEAMRTIATAVVREPSLGSGWESTGPGIPALRGTVVLAAGEGSPAASTTVPRSAGMPGPVASPPDPSDGSRTTAVAMVRIASSGASSKSVSSADRLLGAVSISTMAVHGSAPDCSAVAKAPIAEYARRNRDRFGSPSQEFHADCA